jgi:GntR family transcriptional regulator, sialic acid-inducible nan operon repressor
VRIAGNALFLGLHEALTNWLLDQRTVSLECRGAERNAIDFHTRIFDAIAAHDPDAAEAAMDSHLAKVAHMYRRASKARSRAA